MVGSDENGVGCGGTDSRKGEEEADGAGGLHLIACCGLGVVVAGDSHTSTYGDQDERCQPWDSLLVKDVVDHGRHGREQHPTQLIDGYCGERQGQIGQHHIQTHGQRQLLVTTVSHNVLISSQHLSIAGGLTGNISTNPARLGTNAPILGRLTT